MRSALSFAVLVVPLLAGCAGSGASLPAGSARIYMGTMRTMRAPFGPTSIVPQANEGAVRSACAPSVARGHAYCLGKVRTDGAVFPPFPDSVNGLTPNDLSSLYAYPAPGSQGQSGAGQVVAVLVAHTYRGAEADLGVYRQYFNLPACTTANGCFSEIDASAGSGSESNGDPTSFSAHPTDPNAQGWALETDADIETISAVCPNCHILVVGAASDNLADLGQAAKTAVQSGATLMNASFGGSEDGSQASVVPDFENGQHVKVVAAAGDWGKGVYFPAGTGKVIAVAGTSLSVSGTTVVESLWKKSGYGCSQYFGKQGWQQNQLCHNRLVADVSALADPATGVAFYDSALNGSSGGWGIVGGTSLSAAIISGLYALSGDTASGDGPSTLYQNSSGFSPIGPPLACGPWDQHPCGATTDVPTGLGIPQGLSGF